MASPFVPAFIFFLYHTYLVLGFIEKSFTVQSSNALFITVTSVWILSNRCATCSRVNPISVFPIISCLVAICLCVINCFTMHWYIKHKYLVFANKSNIILIITKTFVQYIVCVYI